ncbi:hypothetical protein CEP54_009409 [Fusarium duplospermum]|uniref:Xylanolytic transcriptional activator regulatory domain-containing protein n=1 Tax=Fusarium duplospermum TaxID=1325734 RepID=A0A428PQT3_9HYPO|nr:hypothetical protein CEP54_009409 [Fusarium duplospermum]
MQRSNRSNSAVYRARHAAQGQPEPDDRRSPINGQERTRRQSNVVAQGTAASTSTPPLQSATGSPANHAEHEDAVSPDRSASALRLVGKSELVPVADLIGISLPPREVVDAVLDSYRGSVQWYIGVLHEPFLRARLLPIVETGLAPPSQRPVLLLALIVLAIGARFISDEARDQNCPGFPLAEVASNMVVGAERWYLPSMDFITVDIVAYSYLLATYYLWNRQTRAAFITTGTTIRAAQFIGLNQETHWGNVSADEKEARRRVWWSVFIGAGFISMSWGTPPMLSEADCNVRQPVDIEDAAEPCPGFCSLEKREDGEFRPVTIGSYNRYKAEMYKIAITIMRQIYFTKHRGPEELCRLISGLHQRLLAWERSIPPELRLESHTSIGSEDNRDAYLRRVFHPSPHSSTQRPDLLRLFEFGFPDIFGEPPDHYSVAAGPFQRSRSSETEASNTEIDGSRSNERDVHGQLAAQFSNLQSTMTESGSERQDLPSCSVPGHIMSDAAYGELFDMPDFLASPQAA